MKTDRADAVFAGMPVGKAVLLLTLPTVASQLITVVYNMTDTYFIGQLNDPAQVAAATIVMPLFMFLTAIANLFGIGGASFMARCFGRHDLQQAGRCAALCVWLAALCALVYGAAVYALRGSLLPFLGTDAATYDYAAQYLFWMVGAASLPVVLNQLLAHLVRAEGHAGAAGFGIALGGIVNALLAPLFIFVLGLQIRGAGMATMLANTIAALYFMLFLYRRRVGTVITLFPGRFTPGGILPEVTAVGLPGFIMVLMATLSNAVLNGLAAGYANEAVAGMGIAKRFDLLAYAIAQGMTQGALPLIAYNFTSGNRARMAAAVKTTFFYSLGVALAGTALLYLGAVPLVGAFIADGVTVAYGQQFLKIIALACPTTAVNFMVITVFQATGEKTKPLLLSLLRKGGLDVPLMFAFNALWGVSGIAWATPAADAAALVLALLLFVPYLRQIKSVREGAAQPR